MIELTDGLRVSGEVSENIRYRYYRFFKACKEACDMEVKIESLQIFSDV
jgi:hypothetical protein